ncbi:C40 family peptidase [Alicyclobacillus shizuokensis]|uniref:C40 family peptidase n=1 Tax=Alicyclobacillus shizuokensis TaxID=392014 RepID=UPI00083633AD|nr:C40 family peptidase [Alicyclobacillus shizuokensis]MCL6625033.1 C40 family peptidase [Alicyclobacillus shizuokensis]
MSIRAALAAGSSLAVAATSFTAAMDTRSGLPREVPAAPCKTNFRSSTLTSKMKIPVEYLRERMRLREIHFSTSKQRFASSWQAQTTVNLQVLGAGHPDCMRSLAKARNAAASRVPASHHTALVLASRGGTTPIRQRPQIAQPRDEHKPAAPPVPSLVSSSTGTTIARLALSMVGSPYVYGGEDPSGFDCSGLAEYVYAKCGIAIPRTSFQQYACGETVARSQLQPGDLVFFATTGSGPTHVAIYVGNGLIVQALNPRTGVIVSHINAPYYTQRYLGARRPWHV